jgi:hypothetical protein
VSSARGTAARLQEKGGSCAVVLLLLLLLLFLLLPVIGREKNTAIGVATKKKEEHRED